MTDTLFELPSPEAPRQHSDVQAEPRLQRPNRAQVELRAVDLEGLLPADHRARLVWDFVEGLDLTPLYAEIKAVEGHAGRPPIDPAILLALWLYATVDGVGSARAVARLCEEHDAYRWLCGGVSVNYHTLADFRVQPVEYLDRLLRIGDIKGVLGSSRPLPTPRRVGHCALPPQVQRGQRACQGIFSGARRHWTGIRDRSRPM